MVILKWISIVVFLLFIAFIILVTIATIFVAIREIVKIFKKYPEISKHWFKENSYEESKYGGYVYFEDYKTKDGTTISISDEDGKTLYDLKTTIECLLGLLLIVFLGCGCYNAMSLFCG